MGGCQRLAWEKFPTAVQDTLKCLAETRWKRDEDKESGAWARSSSRGDTVVLVNEKINCLRLFIKSIVSAANEKKPTTFNRYYSLGKREIRRGIAWRLAKFAPAKRRNRVLHARTRYHVLLSSDFPLASRNELAKTKDLLRESLAFSLFSFFRERNARGERQRDSRVEAKRRKAWNGESNRVRMGMSTDLTSRVNLPGLLVARLNPRISWLENSAEGASISALKRYYQDWPAERERSERCIFIHETRGGK